MAQLNTWSDVSSIAQSVQEDAIFVVRQSAVVAGLVKVYTDMSGGNLRKNYQYNSVTVNSVAETDDLVSQAFTPSALNTLTPAEVGAQFFITDLRRDSDAPENIMTDASRELGLAAADKLENDVVGDLASLTGGTIGAAGTAITWGYLAAAIARGRAVNKSFAAPLVAVIHGYQWAVLAKTASVAGASVVNGQAFQDQINSNGLVAQFMGVPIYQSFADPDGDDDFTGGVFVRECLALDWRRPVRVAPQRDESRRGLELNMSAVYAHGIWRPELGIKMTFDATAPSS